ncbi:MAG: chemotaxis-specific protein-glutamate methyltransferase CheB [Lachnospiraceae bacterium]
MKNILPIDDSALMRRIVCDIIDKESDLCIKDTAGDGLEALQILKKKPIYHLIILDINMPKMDGIDFLKKLHEETYDGVPLFQYQPVVVFSSYTKEGAELTLRCLELGAVDFIKKPTNMFATKYKKFQAKFIRLISSAMEAHQITASDVIADGDLSGKMHPDNTKMGKTVKTADKSRRSGDGSQEMPTSGEHLPMENTNNKNNAERDGVMERKKKKLVAIACSTGGPNALKHVIPLLPANLNAPVVIVQHMPFGFTQSLAERLDALSLLSCKEATAGEKVQRGNVYVAQGGLHMKLGKNSQIIYSDEPVREGVKPCANYMYESLLQSEFDEIICVVLTGMGADGRDGIKSLAEKKKIYVIAQSEPTCTVYGMPRSIVETGLVNQIVDLDNIAQEIISKVGVR